MSIAMNSFKLVVGNLDTAEHFYTALGFKIISRNTGGEAEVAQEQSWLSETGDMGSCMLILSRFLESPPPPRPVYPGESWLEFMVENVDATLALVEQTGGSILRAGQDRPEYGVRAAVVADPEGHIIEIVGPMDAG
jgi:catechol 2,3-dioxygenase-like lactoylglutathione lyase family enzyme